MISVRIAFLACRYRLDLLVPRASLPWIVRVLQLPFGQLGASKPRGERLALALERMGPVFVKLGQILCNRPDFIAPDIALSLERLLKDCQPVPTLHVKQRIEDNLGKPVDQLFASFDETPLASASVAQVHRARLKPEDGGHDVVVKVLKPNVEAAVATCVKWMARMSKLVAISVPEARRLRIEEVVDSYRQDLLGEMDLRREAANTQRTRRDFHGSSLLYIPEVYWKFTSQVTLTMEYVDAVAVTDVPALANSGVHLERLAKRGVEIFLRQVFTHNFFHGDMHPGNIMVLRHNGADPRYVAVDIAVAGSLSDDDRLWLAQTLLALMDHKYDRVAALFVVRGWAHADTDLNHLSTEIGAACEPVMDQPLEDVAFGKILIQLFDTARRHDLRVDPNFALLSRTLLNIEGMGRRLWPSLDFWLIARTFLQQWMRDQVSPSALIEKATDVAPHVLLRLSHVLSHTVRDPHPTPTATPRNALGYIAAISVLGGGAMWYGAPISALGLSTVVVAFCVGWIVSVRR